MYPRVDPEDATAVVEDEPSFPPPTYFPGNAIPRPAKTMMSSKTICVNWLPLRSNWRRWEIELLDTTFPIEWSVHTRSPSESPSISSASTFSSLSSHPLAPIYSAHVATLNDKIQSRLGRTRIWMATLELINLIFAIVLVVAIGVNKGQQGPFLEAVEIGLVLLVLINATVYNQVRVSLPLIFCTGMWTDEDDDRRCD